MQKNGLSRNNQTKVKTTGKKRPDRRWSAVFNQIICNMRMRAWKRSLPKPTCIEYRKQKDGQMGLTVRTMR